MNDLLYQWYRKAVSRKIYPDGPLLKKGKTNSKPPGDTDFIQCIKWLVKSWKKRHNVKQVVVSGEAGEVRGEAVSSWKERLPELSMDMMPKTYGI